MLCEISLSMFGVLIHSCPVAEKELSRWSSVRMKMMFGGVSARRQGSAKNRDPAAIKKAATGFRLARRMSCIAIIVLFLSIRVMPNY